MSRTLVLWALASAVTAVGAIVTYMRCPGCVARDRVNATCGWTDESAFAFDPQNLAHRTHLVEDTQLAEELAIRYADAEHGRRFGVAHHGGLLEGGRVRQDCLSTLFHAIERAHGVTPDQIQVARGQRYPTFDVAVALLFLPFYALGATVAVRWLRRRFGSNERGARWIATGLASVTVALLGTQLFRLWGGVWEAIRVGNGHMTSIRAASSSHWTQQHAGVDLAAGVILFWLVALLGYRTLATDEDVTNLQSPLGILHAQRP